MLDPQVIEIIVEIAIAPKVRTDWDGLVATLDALAADDPSFAPSTDREPGQIILRGASEGQLDAHVATLRRCCGGIAFDVGAPQVAYRETLTRRIDKDYTYRTSVGGGQFARARLVFAPDAIGGFESKIAGGAVPDALIHGVAAGIETVMRSGILAGCPVVGVKATLIDCAVHERESSSLTFEIAARAAFREALRDGGSILLEPVMTVEVTIPDDDLGFVVGDLRARRGEVRGRERHGAVSVVKGSVPLSNMFGYVDRLRAGTQGRGTFTMHFSHYAPVDRRSPDDGPAAPAIALRA